MQPDLSLKAGSMPVLETSLFSLLPRCLEVLQQTSSWLSLQRQFPQLVISLQPLFPQIISNIQIHGDSCYGYKRLKIWTHSSENSLEVMSLVGFVFQLEDKFVLNLHLYNTTESPNKTCYLEPPSSSFNGLKTSVHDHNCLCLSHVAFIDEGLKVMELFYEFTSTGLKNSHVVERSPDQACLDSGDGPYIHQVEVSLAKRA